MLRCWLRGAILVALALAPAGLACSGQIADKDSRLRFLGHLPGVPDGPPTVTRFTSTTQGWAWVRGTARLWATEDAGATWRNVALPTAAEGVSYLIDVFAKSSKEFVIWLDQSLLRTLDGGEHWISLALPSSPQSLSALAFQGDQGLAALGHDFTIRDGFRRQRIYSTTDWGTTWQLRWDGRTDFGPQHRTLIKRIQFAGASHGVALGDQMVLVTRDVGRTWRPGRFQPDGAAGENGRENAQVFLLNSSTGWLLERTGGLFQTADGGKNWSKILDAGGEWVSGGPSAPGGGLVPPDLYFDSETHGWLVGNDSGLYESSDGGRHWSRLRGDGFMQLDCSPAAGCMVSTFDHMLYGLVSGQR
ncbi:hypothetical protein [uncultured Paludibaculum sp.]|uniref:WD40/YVTN/BNR-like repeat-containing protein n=1 Tax=uncultured Paludibaculum sp. TaxID=1765020 RepID=UPI002AABE171|nr:hypothetical protein [uncultured Paludibaculum sp.]